MSLESAPKVSNVSLFYDDLTEYALGDLQPKREDTPLKDFQPGSGGSGGGTPKKTKLRRGQRQAKALTVSTLVILMSLSLLTDIGYSLIP